MSNLCTTDIEELKNLLEAGASNTDKDEALLWASEHSKCIETVKLFLEYGADVHTDDYALILSSENGHLDVVKFLLSQYDEIPDISNECINQALKEMQNSYEIV